MNWIQEYLVLGIGILLRLAIPIVMTFFLAWLLRRLDARWQKEAELERGEVEIGLYPGRSFTPKNAGCWEIKGCKEEQKAVCPAFQHPDLPCWQVFRFNDGVLRAGCLDCSVFRNAPLPARI